ncbi:hypothetical protein JX265_001822 [Neoarthrinium moseri]|uniref:Uncharacterized protein n=1 Tax=Neoarthrinium moseri TaxID=1658444 RepID=A0A9Q0AVG5_9PEZI|nr:hypothetical protein JX266_010300 [Neoarthrinium moseri]KAI1880201.1 hypothetical protein JX265_001822 [Neoarthrinium moseri]
MKLAISFALSALLASVAASPAAPAADWQFPVMDQACTSVGGTVAGHNIESGNALSNCITYCNNVPTGGHDVTGPIAAVPSVPISRDTTYHLYVVDSCSTCDYCGPPRK